VFAQELSLAVEEQEEACRLLRQVLLLGEGLQMVLGEELQLALEEELLLVSAQGVGFAIPVKLFDIPGIGSQGKEFPILL
jgi:hypothetical protein